MMNGSANGSSSAYSSIRAMRMRRQIEETQLAALPLELTARLELQHPCDQTVARMKHERMECSLGTRAVGRWVLGERELEEGMQLYALAAATGIVEDHAARGDVAGARERAVEGGGGGLKAV